MNEDWRKRLQSLVDESELSPEKLCTGIDGVSDKYLRGLLDRPDRSASPNFDKLMKVAAKNRWSFNWIMTGEGLRYSRPGMAEDGAIQICESKQSAIDVRAALILYPGARADVWEVRSNELLLLGYAPGDKILVDPKAVPVAGDAVIANIADQETGTGETVLRQYRPPYLSPAGTDPHLRVYTLGDNEVAVMGVIVGKYRVDLMDRTPSRKPDKAA